MKIGRGTGNYDGQQTQMAIPVHSQFDPGCFRSTSAEVLRLQAGSAGKNSLCHERMIAADLVTGTTSLVVCLAEGRLGKRWKNRMEGRSDKSVR